MRARYVRIEVGAKHSYLVYCRAHIHVVVGIDSQSLTSYGRPRLARAMAQLRRQIQAAREATRDVDELAKKPPRAVLGLLRQKRERLAYRACEEKRPETRARHVGVEIEFVSATGRKNLSVALAQAGLAGYVHLKSDASVSAGDGGSSECEGSCRDNCECSYCGEEHSCDDERECMRRTRYYGSNNPNGVPGWYYNEDCEECTDRESRPGCDCGGTSESGEPQCEGEHVVCDGHCPGHDCLGSEDHPDYDCNCVCDCDSGEAGHEISVVARSTEIARVVTLVCQVLNEHGATVNSTCGLHVHLDMRGHRDVPQAFANLVKAQRLLYSMVPLRRSQNSYCRPNPSIVMDSYVGRYWGINPSAYQEHKTLEVRLHSGTTDARKITNWIQLLQKIAYGKRIKQVERLGDLTDVVKLPGPLLEYVRSRIQKFKSQHGPDSLPLDEPEATLAAPYPAEVA